MAKSDNTGAGYTGFGFSAFGLLTGALFFTASLTPSLMPRDAVMQGILAGVVGAIGYQLAIIWRYLWRYLMLPEPRNDVAQNLAVIALLAAGAVLIYGLWASHHWQNVTRLVMGIGPVESAHRLTIGGIGVVVFLVVVALFKLFVMAAGGIKELAQRLMPERIALGIGVDDGLFGPTRPVGWAICPSSPYKDGRIAQPACQSLDRST